MALSSDLVSQFVQVTKEEKKSNETTVFGTIVEYDGAKYVKLDGSELLTPISMTADALEGERVTVMLKNHTAIVTGNLSSPAARTGTVDEIGTKISEFEIIIADKVSVDRLEAEIARIDTLVSENVTIKGRLDANEANIKELTAENVTIDGKLTAAEADIDKLKTNKLDAAVANITYATITDLKATNAEINNLEATYANFKVTTTDRLDAAEANIKDLNVKKLDVEDANLKYANIDFANIGDAAIENFFAKSGIITDLVGSNGSFTGTLVGVTIKGDLIEGGTVVADKLVVKGEDGLYYKLNVDGETVEAEQTEYNSLNGSIITANTITANKINVDDLVAFDATIGGFKITEDALYSGVKESADNTTQGIYMDSSGQLVVGDSNNFLKYYRDDDGNYILDISSVTAAEDRLNETIQTEKTELIATTEKMILEAASSYVETGDYETFKQTTEAALSIMSDRIDMNFTTTTEEINEVDGDVQSKFTELYKYIQFSGETAITIGSGDNSIVLEIDNETGIAFKKNGVVIGLWDGEDFYTGNVIVDVTERAQFGNFAFIPRSDGSLSFLHVGSKNPITITSQPEDLSVSSGETAVFSVVVSGKKLTYQWYESLIDSSDTFTPLDSADATSSSITVNSEDYIDCTYFKCIITNATGSTVETRVAKLEIT